jgi:peptidoglycan/xylan/chitin deacetylase (PgdA/CDA1 family)
MYLDNRLAFDPRWADRDPSGELHFAPELVQQIASAPNQELASHTFSHIFLGEPGVMARDVIADSRAVAEVFEQRFGKPPRSIVFPRNQVAFLKQLFAAGIRAARTNPRAWYWDRISANESLLLRARRFIEGLAPWELRSAPPNTDRDTGMVCTQASVFLRLGKLPAPLFRLQREKVAREAKRLGPGDVLHLWFHPHNLGADPDTSLGRLESLLDTLQEQLHAGTRFVTMSDLT